MSYLLVNVHITLPVKLFLIEINYVLSVDAQTVPSRVILMQENSAVSTGRISGSLTLMKGQQMCVNTTAILEVSNYDYFHYVEKCLRNEVNEVLFHQRIL